MLVPREAQGARPSENARALLLHGVLKGASVHRYLTFALSRDASSPVVRRRLIDVCVRTSLPTDRFTKLAVIGALQILCRLHPLSRGGYAFQC